MEKNNKLLKFIYYLFWSCIIFGLVLWSGAKISYAGEGAMSTGDRTLIAAMVFVMLGLLLALTYCIWKIICLFFFNNKGKESKENHKKEEEKKISKNNSNNNNSNDINNSN